MSREIIIGGIGGNLIDALVSSVLAVAGVAGVILLPVYLLSVVGLMGAAFLITAATTICAAMWSKILAVALATPTGDVGNQTTWLAGRLAQLILRINNIGIWWIAGITWLVLALLLLTLYIVPRLTKR